MDLKTLTPEEKEELQRQIAADRDLAHAVLEQILRTPELARPLCEYYGVSDPQNLLTLWELSHPRHRRREGADEASP